MTTQIYCLFFHIYCQKDFSLYDFMDCMHKYFAHVPLQNCRSSFGPEWTLSSHVPAGRKYWPELHSRKSTAVGFSKLGQGRVFFLRLSASIPIRLQTVQSNIYFYTEQNLDTWWTVQDLVLLNQSCFVHVSESFSLHTHCISFTSIQCTC